MLYASEDYSQTHNLPWPNPNHNLPTPTSTINVSGLGGLLPHPHLTLLLDRFNFRRSSWIGFWHKGIILVMPKCKASPFYPWTMSEHTALYRSTYFCPTTSFQKLWWITIDWWYISKCSSCPSKSILEDEAQRILDREAIRFRIS